MGFREDLKSAVTSIFVGRWTIENTQSVPQPEDLRLNENHGKRLTNAVVLYADIDGSTGMVDNQSDTFSAEVYKAYLHSASQIIKRNNGVITAYDGDRVMGVFYDETSRNTNAVTAALELNYAVNEIIRPAYSFYNALNGFVLQHVVGIDRSDLLAARIGVRGDNDIVWVGRAANHAAKFCSYSGTPIWISKSVYDNINDRVKYNTGAATGINMWQSHWKVIGTSVVEVCSSTYHRSF